MALNPIRTAIRIPRAVLRAPARRVGNAATADSLPSSSATPIPMTGMVAPTNTAVMPVIEKPADTVASDKAAIVAVIVTARPV